MSISRQNLSIVIVTLKSEKVIHQCIKSLNQNIPIIVVEHSDNKKLKEDLEKKYNNLKCILAKSNLGMGSGNNVGIKAANTDYVLLLNPDVLLEDNTIEELFLASQNLANFSMLAPLEKNFNNYGFLNKKKSNKNLEDAPFEVDFIDGFAMLINKKKFKEIDYFDENFFMYLENNDLCKRSRNKGDLIYIVPKSRINHLAAKAVDKKYEDEVEFSRNWHWIWSKFYFNKKHYGFLNAFSKIFMNLVSSKIKFIYYLITLNSYKRKIHQMRISGLFSSMIGKKSYLRLKN